MQGTLIQWLNQNVADGRERKAFWGVFSPVLDRLSTQVHSSGGLAIKTGGSAIVKTGSAFYATVQGKLVTKTANTDMAALAGTVTNAKFNIYCFFIDSAGTLTSAMGVEGSTIGAVKFPPIPQGKALIGFVVINPTGTGNFQGGTTALDDVTVVPNAAYVNAVAPFDPTAIIQ